MTLLRTAAILLVAALASCHSGSDPKAAPAKSAAAQTAPPVTLPASMTPVSRPDPWWQQRHGDILAKARQGGYDTVFLGDSITQGWEGAGKDVWAATPAMAHALNAGISGDRVQHVKWRLDSGLLDALAAPNNHIKTAVLLIGTNNTSAPADIGADIGAGVRDLVASLRTRLPNAKIIVMKVFPRDQFPSPKRDTIAIINADLDKLKPDAHVTLLDISDAFFLTPNTRAELNKELMPDYLHLSPEGYKIWADRVSPLLAR